VEWYWQNKQKYWETKPSHVHQKTPETEPGPERWQARSKSLGHSKNLYKMNIKPELYLNTQSVPRSKHPPSLFYKPVR
jgi:hypothetical protein